MLAKKYPLIALVLLVPVLVIGFFIVRSLSLENEALNVRRERLVEQRIEAAATQIGARLRNLATDILAQTQTAYAAGGADALTKLSRQHVFAYAAVFQSGAPVHSLTALEHQYDATRVLQDEAFTLARGLSATQPSLSALISTGSEYVLFRCAQVQTANDICVAVNSHQVMEALRSEVAAITANTDLAHVGLVAPNGVTINATDGEKLSSKSFAMSGLLQHWQFRAEERPTATGWPIELYVYLISGMLIAGWAAMTWAMYQSNAAREAAAAARAGVIAQLAHELRTPLTNLRLHTDLMKRKVGANSGLERNWGVLDSEIGRLTNLAENAIAVARGDIAQKKLEAASPDDCLRAIIERFEPTLSEARCRIEFSPGASNVCHFDKTSWERCVVNLLDNARKYAAGSVIHMATTQSGETLRLDITDQGPGIAADQRERVFEPLERGPSSGASGFGLGLAATRALARQNGGDCWIDNAEVGSHFVLTFSSATSGVSV